MNCDNCKFIFWCRFKRDMQKMGAKITSCPDYKPREEPYYNAGVFIRPVDD
jgi:hypothetical protein